VTARWSFNGVAVSGFHSAPRGGVAMRRTFPREGKGIGDASGRLLGAQRRRGTHDGGRKGGGSGSCSKVLEEDEGANWAD
jgi:hypothetical protein